MSSREKTDEQVVVGSHWRTSKVALVGYPELAQRVQEGVLEALRHEVEQRQMRTVSCVSVVMAYEKWVETDVRPYWADASDRRPWHEAVACESTEADTVVLTAEVVCVPA